MISYLISYSVLGLCFLAIANDIQKASTLERFFIFLFWPVVMVLMAMIIFLVKKPQ